jgi:hypothetical protein
MNSLFFGTLTFLVVLPAISICDEDLTKASETATAKTDNEDSVVPRHPSLQNFYDDAESDYNDINDPWAFYRQLRAPSGFSAVRGKKSFEPEDNWEFDVNE